MPITYSIVFTCFIHFFRLFSEPNLSPDCRPELMPMPSPLESPKPDFRLKSSYWLEPKCTSKCKPMTQFQVMFLVCDIVLGRISSLGLVFRFNFESRKPSFGHISGSTWGLTLSPFFHIRVFSSFRSGNFGPHGQFQT